MPSVVHRVRRGRAVPEAAPRIEAMFPQMVGRTCHLKPYTRVPVPKAKVQGEIITYASPDSTFAVTKRLFDAARRSILIGIYDFTAPHVKQLVSDALARGVKVRLMLDIDSAEEQALFDDLVTLGMQGVPAPSCASQHGNPYFRSSHEKVIVIDEEWVLVQSGNYSANSCPLNVKDGGDAAHFVPGNRDSGLAVRSRPLASFFTGILSSDMALELGSPQAAAAAPREHEAFLVERAPTLTPSTLYPSKTYKLAAPLEVQPVLSPDNYMDVVPGVLRAARRSILIEQQYIRAAEEKISDLLDAIRDAKRGNSRLDVRIVLGKVFSASDLPREREMLLRLEQVCGLKLGRNVRYVNTQRLVHCHNKMVLVDGSGVLVSSQNWSKAAVWENREAGLYFQHKGVCGYFTRIFETDWKDAFRQLPAAAAESLTPHDLAGGGYVRVDPGDYAEV